MRMCSLRRTVHLNRLVDGFKIYQFDALLHQCNTPPIFEGEKVNSQNKIIL